MPATINRAGSLFSVFFAPGPVRDFAQASAADHARYARWHRGMLERGVYLPPSGYELWTLCTAFGERETDRLLSSAREVVTELR